jgi:hypothetical protein
MRSALLFILSILPIILSAQPTITKDFIGEESSTFGQIVAEQAPDPGPAGANVQWNFSSILPNDTVPPVVVEFVDPFDTPYHAEFPDANLAETIQNLPLFWNYYKLTDQKYEVLGNAGEIGPTVSLVKYDDPQTILEFPFTYNSSFSDNFSGQSDFGGGFTQLFFGSNSTVGDAWGKIILPNGTFTNVLRIKDIQHRTDSSEMFNVLTLNKRTTTTYLWYSESANNSVAGWNQSSGYSITKINGVLIGDTVFINSQPMFFYNHIATTSTGKVDLNNPAIIVFPSIGNSTLKVSYSNDQFDEVECAIFDFNGNQVFSQKVRGVPGENEIQLEHNLTSGPYMVQIKGKTIIGIHRFIVTE